MLKRFVQAVVLVCCQWYAVGVSAHELPQFTELVKQNSPAVVNISATQNPVSAKSLGNSTPDNEEQMIDELMKRFFDYDGRGASPFDYGGDALGSGFIYSADGYIVTNRHVIDNAHEIKVKLSDGRELAASVVGSDDRSDLALLKIAADNLPVLKMGDSEQLEVGEWVLAIGSPFGFDHSATVGIVSAKGRSLPDDSYVPFIQTDVAINPGNSGGPLFNLKGEVVGINSQIYSRSGGFMGVSFAIPMAVASNIVEQLKTNGRVTRGWLGIYIQDLDADLAQSFQLDQPTGALITQIMPTGPTAQILKSGDVVLAFNGQTVHNAAELPLLVAGKTVGSQVKLKVWRAGKIETVAVTVAELPNSNRLETDN